jgi:hypothetical protein
VAGSKNCPPYTPSNISMNSAVEMIGTANSSRKLVTSAIQMNTGMRMKVMPGARMFRIVTMKLIDAASELMPRALMPIA